MPSKAIHYGELVAELKAEFNKADREHIKLRLPEGDESTKVLLEGLMNVARQYFPQVEDEVDEAQAQCALRRYLLYRYGWSLKICDAELDKAGIELCLPGLKVLV